ncbi:MAG: S1C family serine protease, partial [Anaerolineales bacterium]
EVIAALVGRDPRSDLALLRLKEAALTVVSLATGETRVGQLALALGRPSHLGIQASLGIVSAVGNAVRVVQRSRRHGPRGPGYRGYYHRKIRSRSTRIAEQFIRTDATPYPGFSGGPLIDAAGDVIGINTSGLLRGMSIAIPIARAWQIAESLDKHGGVKRGYLGIRSQPVPLPADQQELLGREQATGLLLVWVEEGGPAAQGGLLVGDILVGLAGEILRNYKFGFLVRSSANPPRLRFCAVENRQQ